MHLDTEHRERLLSQLAENRRVLEERLEQQRISHDTELRRRLEARANRKRVRLGRKMAEEMAVRKAQEVEEARERRRVQAEEKKQKEEAARKQREEMAKQAKAVQEAAKKAGIDRPRDGAADGAAGALPASGAGIDAAQAQASRSVLQAPPSKPKASS